MHTNDAGNAQQADSLDVVDVSKNDAGQNFHRFKKPYVFEGETHEGIQLDFEPLTGKDMIETAKQYNARGNFAVLPAYDTGFCALIAARASNKPAQFIEGLPLGDFNQVVSKVTRFLTQAD